MDQNIPSITLNNGTKIPQFGLGVFKMEPGAETEAAVATALKAGYRAIDTAKAYGNEESVGKAVSASGLAREDVFITTKLWNDDQGYDNTLKAIDESLEKLGMDYVDLYLIHWPKPAKGLAKETWKAFEEIAEAGKARAIGVSNFLPEHLQELLEDARIVPAVNQIELHPMLTQTELREYCQDKGIHVESWSPLMRAGELLEHDVITKLAEKHGKEPAQIVLRWHIQSDLIVIPKSSTPERIRSNIQIFDFELSPEDMHAIDELNQEKRTGPHPAEF